jgi:hypothetical protein
MFADMLDNVIDVYALLMQVAVVAVIVAVVKLIGMRHSKTISAF